MEDKLLPCPLCGHDSRQPKPQDPYTWCTNHNCVMSGIEIHKDKWNKRPTTKQYTHEKLVEVISTHVYASCENHLSGARLIVGFKTLPEAQAALEAIDAVKIKGRV